VTALESRLVLQDCKAGPEAHWWISGGFQSARIDVGPMRFFANQTGGFRVSCPETGGNLVPTFSSALAKWRAGGARDLLCGLCGERHSLEYLDFVPPAAFATAAVTFADVASASLTSEGLGLLHDLLPSARVVLRRP
jgi:hypothetical protein